MNDLELLITGGVGSLGKALLKILTTKYKPKGIRIFSRDELKQSQLKTEYKDCKTPISYIVGDVRDVRTLSRAFKGVDIVIHAAAMKRIETCEENPIEAINTNVNGAINVIETAIIHDVKKVMNVSTDKSVYPVNLYGASKMAAEKLFENASVYTNGKTTKFATCRYGNVLGSRGSVIHAFRQQMKDHGKLFITHPDMTRFFITLDRVAQFLIDRIEFMVNGSTYIPAMRTTKIERLAKIIYPNCEIQYTDIRHGEKLHECLISEEESLQTIRNLHLDKIDYYEIIKRNVNGENSFTLTSQGIINALTCDEIQEMVEGV